MKSRKGFTLIELMVVVLIVAILAAVIVPMMRARIDAAKWSEGRAGIGTISTAARAYWAEHQDQAVLVTDAPTLAQLFPTADDLGGKYFEQASYSIVWTQYNNAGAAYSITCSATLSTRTNKPTNPATMTLAVAANGTSTWTEG
ncbi:MAG: type II secretion system protein [Phycisphaerae bacterium]|nr:type II secretion system protein [Phycisphaerae bacterium]